MILARLRLRLRHLLGLAQTDAEERRPPRQVAANQGMHCALGIATAAPFEMAAAPWWAGMLAAALVWSLAWEGRQFLTGRWQDRSRVLRDWAADAACYQAGALALRAMVHASAAGSVWIALGAWAAAMVALAAIVFGLALAFGRAPGEDALDAPR